VVFPKLFARPRYAVAIATCALLLALGGHGLGRRTTPCITTMMDTGACP
jgi:hypothetical protein